MVAPVPTYGILVSLAEMVLGQAGQSDAGHEVGLDEEFGLGPLISKDTLLPNPVPDTELGQGGKGVPKVDNN